MIQELERIKPLTKAPATAGTWIQVTFTLSSEQYRMLWQRAEEEHLAIPAFVRENILDYLEQTEAMTLKRNSASKLAGGDLL